jgi:hypothetical protein
MSFKKKFNRKINLEVQSHSLVNQIKRADEEPAKPEINKKNTKARKKNARTKSTKPSKRTTSASTNEPNEEMNQS